MAGHLAREFRHAVALRFPKDQRLDSAKEFFFKNATAEGFFPYSMGEELKIQLRFVQGIYVPRSAPKAFHSDTSEKLVN
jgi:hypothetical protein